MKIPLTFDKTPYGKIVVAAEIGEDGYYENEEFTLSLHPSIDGVLIEYSGDNGSEASEDEIIMAIKEFNKKILNEL